MPTSDALRLGNLLLATTFRDRVACRWQRGSWRMHIPLVFDANYGITLDDTGQIHLPKDQVPDLTRTLEHMTA